MTPARKNRGKSPRPTPGSKRAGAAQVEQVEAQHALGEPVVQGAVGLRLDAVRAALAARNPLRLCPYRTEQELVDALLDAASNREHESWAAVLQQAKVPWLAWVALRRVMPAESEVLFQTWAFRVADECARDTVQIADVADTLVVDNSAATPQVRSALEHAAMAHAALRVKARAWMAERLDPQVYAARKTTNVTGGRTDKKTVTVVLRDEA